MTTHVFWDVDGVYNAFGGRYFDDADPWGDLLQVNVMGYVITYSPTFVARVNALAAREDVKTYWLTTWEDSAADELSPALGIEGREWPVAGTVSHMDRPWWKLTAIQMWADKIHAENPDDKIVWVDDDFHGDHEASGWVRQYNLRTDMDEIATRILAVCPVTHLGVTPEQMDEIEAFAA